MQITLEQIRIHLPADVQLGDLRKKIRKAGGTISDCRGYSTTRYISLPATERVLIWRLFDLTSVHMKSIGYELHRKSIPMFASCAGDTALPSWCRSMHLAADYPLDPVEALQEHINAMRKKYHDQLIHT